MGKRSREKRDKSLDPTPALPVQPPAWDPAAESADRPVPPKPWGALLREHWIPLVVIGLLALTVRGAALAFIGHSPYREVANIDSDAYIKWAKDILTTGWAPTRQFYQSPVYAYYLAAVYKLFGEGTWVPRVIQILLGSASAMLLYAIGANLFVRRVGWIAGIGLAFYGPLILEEVTISKTTLPVFTLLASLAIFSRYAPSIGWLGIAFSGLLFGLSVSGVGQWLLGFLLFGVLAGLIYPDPSTKRRVLASATFLAAGLCIIGPEAAWNTCKAGGFLLTGGGGLNFYEGNNERASSLPARPDGVRDIPEYEETDSWRVAERRAQRKMNAAEVSRYWTREALHFITQQPGAYLTLLWKKFQIAWNAYEIPDNYQYAFMRDNFIPVFYGCLSFGQIAPLALIGLAFPFWRRRKVLALVVLCFSYFVTLLLFYIRSRYRIPMAPFLLIFAAVAVERGIGWLKAWDWRLACGVTGLAVAWMFVNQSYCEPPAHGFRQVCMANDIWYDQEWMKIGAWYDVKGDLDRAIYYFRKATDNSTPRGPGETWFWLGSLEQRKVDALLARNETGAIREHVDWADTAYRRCVTLGHRRPAAYYNLTLLYARAHIGDRITKTIDEATRAGALDRPAIFRMARGQAQVRNCAGAELLLTEADKDLGYYSPAAKSILAACTSH